VISPSAPVALAERNLLVFVTAITLVVVVPVFVLTFWVVKRFRADHAAGPYRPNWTYSKPLDLAIWLVAGTAAVMIGVIIWVSTHRLDPYKPVGPAKPPLKVQVISEDWKWLFVYPKQHIAVVNQLVFPTRRPLKLRITSDTVMNSLYIPGLVGQIYAMAGMQTYLNAIAYKPAKFVGRNTQFSGKGFPDQHFNVKAVSPARFRHWVNKVKRSPKTLNASTYAKLRKPSAQVPVTYYSGVEHDLFDRVMDSYKQAPANALTNKRNSNRQGGA